MSEPCSKPAIRIVLALCAVVSVTSCTLLSPVSSDSSKALLDKLPVPAARQTTHPVTLLVLPPRANPVFDTTRIAYTTHPYQIDYFTQREWAATPAQMLLPLLTTTLEQTGYFGAVLTPPYAGNYSYALQTDIVALTQDFTTEPATLKLELRVQLSSGDSGRIIATRDITQREPLQEKSSAAGVAAANRANARVLQEVADFVLESVEQVSR
jgi:cholesterol transport system auxiliary component